jgi:hypothetical protein
MTTDQITQADSKIRLLDSTQVDAVAGGMVDKRGTVFLPPPPPTQGTIRMPHR